MNRFFNRSVIVNLLLVTVLMLTACGSSSEPEQPAEPPAPATTHTPTPDTATPVPTQSEAVEPEPAEATEGADTQQTEPDEASEAEKAYPPPAETPTPAAAAEAEAAYPPPQTVAETDSGEPEAYPPPVTPTEATSSIPIVPFVLERPVVTGATVLRGTGPANVPILAVNVTAMGELLGETVIDENGAFEITVPALEQSTWVGIGLNDLAGTRLTFEDFYANGFRGEDAAQVPNVGFVYDSITVGP